MCRESLHKVGRAKVSVSREVHAAGDARQHVRLELAHLRGVERLSGDVEFIEQMRLFDAAFVTAPRRVNQQRAFALVAELQAVECSQLVEQREAGLAQIAKHGDRLPHRAFAACPGEPQQPPKQCEVEARLDVERTLGVEQPAQSLCQDAQRGKGDTVARHDQPGVAVGAACGDATLLDERDPLSLLGQVIRRADADHPAADDEDVVVRFHSLFRVYANPCPRSSEACYSVHLNSVTDPCREGGAAPLLSPCSGGVGGGSAARPGRKRQIRIKYPPMQQSQIDYNRKWHVMAAVTMGIFLATIDGSIVNLALPTLVRDLQANFPTVQWVVLA